MGSNPEDSDSSTNNWIPVDSAEHTSGAVAELPSLAVRDSNKAGGPNRVQGQMLEAHTAVSPH